MQGASGAQARYGSGNGEHRDCAVSGVDESDVAQLRQWVSAFSKLRLDRAVASPPATAEGRPWAYSSFADLVMQHGRMYPPASSHGQSGRPLPGRCFAAAHAWAHRQGWTYVEGYALAPSCLDTPVFEHAWCLTPGGRVADPSLPDGLVTLYWGVPLTDVFRAGQNRGDDAVLTFGSDPFLGANTTILRQGLPEDALATHHRPDVGG